MRLVLILVLLLSPAAGFAHGRNLRIWLSQIRSERYVDVSAAAQSIARLPPNTHLWLPLYQSIKRIEDLVDRYAEGARGFEAYEALESLEIALGRHAPATLAYARALIGLYQPGPAAAEDLVTRLSFELSRTRPDLLSEVFIELTTAEAPGNQEKRSLIAAVLSSHGHPMTSELVTPLLSSILAQDRLSNSSWRHVQTALGNIKQGAGEVLPRLTKHYEILLGPGNEAASSDDSRQRKIRFLMRCLAYVDPQNPATIRMVTDLYRVGKTLGSDEVFDAQGAATLFYARHGRERVEQTFDPVADASLQLRRILDTERSVGLLQFTPSPFQDGIVRYLLRLSPGERRVYLMEIAETTSEARTKATVEDLLAKGPATLREELGKVPGCARFIVEG